MKKLDSQQQARKKLWVKQTGIKERFPARDLSQQQRRSLRKEEGPRQPPTRGLRGWRNCFLRVWGFWRRSCHSHGLWREKRPPPSPHGFALPKTLLMLNNNPAGYPGHRPVLCSKLTTFQNQFRLMCNARALRPPRYIKDCLVVICKFIWEVKLSSPALMLERKGV